MELFYVWFCANIDYIKLMFWMESFKESNDTFDR